MPYDMRALDVNFELGQFVSLAIQHHAILESLARLFFEHPNQRDNQAELCQIKKVCLSCKRDHVFRQFTAGNYVP
jgi:hypothetical protein